MIKNVDMRAHSWPALSEMHRLGVRPTAHIPSNTCVKCNLTDFQAAYASKFNLSY